MWMINTLIGVLLILIGWELREPSYFTGGLVNLAAAVVIYAIDKDWI